MPSSYAIGEHFEQFIRQQIESGRYASASEVVRDALRLLESRERLRQIELEEYREKIREGMDSGPGIPVDEVFARLEVKYQAMLERQG
jgi:antitoxin ParD1/3/4